MQMSDKHFTAHYEIGVYKKNSSLAQLLRQAEVDALGISMSDEGAKLYAVDVAYHENGLNYGGRKETVEGIAKKFLRTSMCLHGYFEINDGEIIFASPKINASVFNDIEPIMTDLNFLLSKYNFGFKARLIANDDFNEKILKPIITASDGVADTSELFMRAYQLTKMFERTKTVNSFSRKVAPEQVSTPSVKTSSDINVTIESLKELKVGKIAQTVLRELLEGDKISHEEIALMQTEEYSKQKFNLNYPLLDIMCRESSGLKRYYVEPLTTDGTKFYMCSQWNPNTKEFLLQWLSEKL